MAALPQSSPSASPSSAAVFPFLVYRDEGGAQRLLELTPGSERVTVGRRVEADVALGWDEEVSRLHAILECVGGEWTHRRRRAVAERHLRQRCARRGVAASDGDVIRVGNTRWRSRPAARRVPRRLRRADARRRAHLRRAEEVLVALCRPSPTPRPSPGRRRTSRSPRAVPSIDTVKTHMRTLFEKLALGDVPHNRKRAALVERALTLGIVSARDLRVPAQ